MFRYLIESGEYMEAMVKRCAGLDVHQETIVVCVLTGELDVNYNFKMYRNEEKLSI